MNFDSISIKGINSTGKVTGTCYSPDCNRGFVWDNGIMTLLNTLGGEMGFGSAINDAGVVVGYSSTSSEQNHAAIWNNGVISDLGTLGGSSSNANAINSLGTICGYSTVTPSQAAHAVVWINRVINDINNLIPANSGWVLSSAVDINDSGQIIGRGKLNGVSKSYIFDVSTCQIKPVSMPNGADCTARSINNSGEVVGEFSVGDYGETHPFLRKADGTMIDLGTCQGFFSAAVSSSNDNSDIVGNLIDMDTMANTAFMRKDGVNKDLNTLLPPDSGYRLERALCINTKGQIVCTAETDTLLLTPMITDFVANKQAGDNASIDLTAIPVHTAYKDYFYVETSNRAWGIKVHKAGHTLTDGMKANVSGTLMTGNDGERYIEATNAVQNGQGNIKPFAIGNKAIGGTDFCYSTGLIAQKGTLNGYGPNNIGLRIKTWGKVIEVDSSSTPKWFRISDRSNGTLKVLLSDGVVFNPKWIFVVVNGASSCEKPGNDLTPAIRVAKQSDITPLQMAK